MPQNSVDLPAWATYSASAVAGLAAVLAAVHRAAPWLKGLWSAARAKNEREDVVRNARVSRHLRLLIDEWLVRLGAQRVLLIAARDSGTPWPVEAPIKVSCLDQVVARYELQTWDRWQDWRADPMYRKLLNDLIISESNDRGILLTTSTMESGALRDAYEAQGTVASVLFAICWRPGHTFIYVSVNFGRLNHTSGEVATYEKQARDFYHDPEHIRSKVEAARAAWRNR